MSGANALQALERATIVHDAAAVKRAVEQMAVRIDLELGEREPIVMAVLQGGVYLTGQLLPLLNFPLQQASVHVSRYSAGQPGDLIWHARPTMPVAGRTVLIVDDVFDEGLTLAALAAHLAEQHAGAVYAAVLANKAVPKKTPFRPHFVALECGSEYLFGCGMDMDGYWRNLPAIYAASAS